MYFKYSLSFLFYLLNLEHIFCLQSILDQKTFMNNTQDIFPIDNKENNLEVFTITYFVRFKSYVTPSTLLNPRSIFVIKDSNFKKIETIYTTSNNTLNFCLKINDQLLFTEQIADFQNSIYNWFFFSITYQNDNLFWYIEDSTRNLTLTTQFIKNVSIIPIYNNSIILNPLKQNLGLEIAKLNIDQVNALDFYINSNMKSSNLYKFPKDCDADCTKCDNISGICYECSSGNIPTDNKCPPNYVNITEYQYFKGDSYNSLNYHIKSKLNSSISQFNSKSYTLTFWIRTISKNTTLSSYNEENYFSLYSAISPYPDFISNLTFPLSLKTTKNSKFLYIYSNINKFQIITSIYLNTESWYFVSIGFEVEQKYIHLYIRSNCPNQSELYNNYILNNTQIDHMNELTYISHNFLSYSHLPLNGIISKFKIYYNSFLSLNEIISIYSNIVFKLDQTLSFSSNIFPCGLPYSYTSKCGSMITQISMIPNDCSKYIDFSKLVFDPFPVPENNLEEFSMDLWFFSEWQQIQNVSYTLRWENHLIVSINPTIRFSIYCNPNEQTYDLTPWYTSSFVDRNQSTWHYYRCSVSLSAMKLLQILDDSHSYYSAKFVIPRNITDSSTSNLTYFSSTFSYQNRNFLIRNLRLFNIFFSEKIDLKYKNLNKSLFPFIILFFPFDFLSNKLTSNEVSDPLNIKQIQFKVLNYSSSEIILPSEFIDLITCDLNQFFNNTTCYEITNFIPNCKVQIDNNNCALCSSYYFLSNGLCVQNCPTINYYISNIECSNCSHGCSECSSKNPCTKCKDTSFTPPNCYQKYLSSFSNSMYKLEIPINSLNKVIAFDGYFRIPMRDNSYGRRYNIDFYPMMLGRLVYRKNWAIFYAMNDFLSNRDSNMYVNITADFSISQDSWHRLIMINDQIKSVVYCSLDDIIIPTSNPAKFFPNKGFFINRLKEQYLTYVRDIKIWTTDSINLINYFDQYKNSFYNAYPKNLLNYFKMIEGQGSFIYDHFKSTSIKIENMMNRNYNFKWTSLEICDNGYYANYTNLNNSNSCIKCPNNCLSCSSTSGIMVCTLCEEGFYLSNNYCVESPFKGISLSDANSSKILIYDSNKALDFNWTAIFWVKLFDYAYIDNYLTRDNIIASFNFLNVYLDNNLNLIFKGYSEFIQFDFGNCFDQWTIIGVSWNTANTFKYVYLNNNYYNYVNGAQSLLSNNYQLYSIQVGTSALGILKRFQLVKTNTTYNEAMKFSDLKSYESPLFLYYYEYHHPSRGFMDMISMTIPQNVNFNKSLVNIIDEKPTCPENKFLFNNTLNCYDCFEGCIGCIDNSTNCIKCAPNFFRQENECVRSCSIGYALDNSSSICKHLTFFKSFQYSVEIPNSANGLTIEFWGYLKSTNPYEFKGYYITYGGVFIIEILGGFSIPKAKVSYYGNRNYSLINTFSNNQWFYHKASVNFISFIRYNSLITSLDTEEYPSFFNSSLLFSSLYTDYEPNHSLYLKNFKLWKIPFNNPFDISRNDISTYHSNLIAYHLEFIKQSIVSNLVQKNSNYSVIYSNIPSFPTICPNSFYYSPLNDTCLKFIPSDHCNYSIYNNPPLCLSCLDGYIYFDENSTCVRNCPTQRYYLDTNTNICYKCHKECLSCSKYGRQSCLSCDIKSEMNFILQNSTCTSSCLSPDEIYNNITSSCVNVQSFFLTSTINAPDNFNVLTESNLTLKLDFSNILRSEDLLLLNQMKYMWTVDNFSKDFLTINERGFSLEVSFNKSKFNKTFFIQPIFNISVYYKDNLVFSRNKSIMIKEFYLVPIIKYEDNLFFYANHSIFIDASLSYDESTTFNQLIKPIDDTLLFRWECPFPFNYSYSCQKNGSNLLIPYKEYSDFINVQSFINNQSFNFSLQISKNNRTTSKVFNITLLPLSADILLKNIIEIAQEGNPYSGILSLFTIINIPSLYQELVFYWDVNNRINEKDLYLNGRDQHVVKLNINYLSYGKNLIKLKISKRNNLSDSAEFTYSFYRTTPPSNGTCVVSPNKGISLVTNFTFYALNWKSEFPPLMYNVIFETNNNLSISIFNSFSFSNILNSNSLPPGNSFKLQVMDKSGNTITSNCELEVEENKNISLFQITDSITDPFEKLKIVSIYSSSVPPSNMSVNDTNLVLNTIINSVSNLNMSSEYLNSQTISMGLLNMNSITNSTTLLKKLNNDSKELLTSTISAIINTSKAFIYNEKIVSNIYNTLDNLLKTSDFSSEKDISTNILDEAQYKKINRITNDFNVEYLNNLVSGDAKTIETSSFQLNVAKLTNINVGSFSINSNSNNLTSPNINNHKTLNEECTETSTFCLSRKKVNKIFKNVNKEENLYGLAILAQYNKKNIIPLGLNEKQFIFSNDNINFSIYKYPIENITDQSRRILSSQSRFTLRRLEMKDQVSLQNEIKTDMNYVVRLKMKESMYKNPPKSYISNDTDFSDSDNLIGNTACIQFNENNKILNSSCETWYDYKNGFIICKCSLPGLTLNIWDDSISEFSKLSQFPKIDFKTSKFLLISASFWAIITVGFLLMVFLLNLIIWVMNDILDNKRKTRELKYFDSYQYSFNHFIKNKLHTDRSFYKLFKYILKRCHTISVITMYYSEHYTRSLRLIDFFLRLYFTLFFSLIPLYVYDDKSKELIKMRRNINEMGTDINNLPLKIKEFFMQLIYSIAASTVTFILLMLIDLIYYENVVLNNSNETRFYLKKFIDVCTKQEKRDWLSKIKRSFIKLKALRYLAEYFCDKSNESEVFYKNNLHIRGSEYVDGKNHHLEIEMKIIRKEDENTHISINPKQELSLQNNISKNLVKENKAILFYNKRKKNIILNINSCNYDKRERLLSDYSEEDYNRHLNQKRSFVELEDFSDTRIAVPKISVLNNGQMVMIQHKYSFSYIGTYNIQIDSDDYSYITDEKEYCLSTFKSQFLRRNALTSDLIIVHYNLSFLPIKIVQNKNITRLRKSIKIIISVFLIFILLSYMVKFISGSYEHYGNRFFSLWILPIMLMIFSNLIVVEILMICFFTFLINLWGKQVYLKKRMGIVYFLISYIVPKEILVVHKSVLEFREIYNRTKKNL